MGDLRTLSFEEVIFCSLWGRGSIDIVGPRKELEDRIFGLNGKQERERFCTDGAVVRLSFGRRAFHHGSIGRNFIDICHLSCSRLKDRLVGTPHVESGENYNCFLSLEQVLFSR
jgi:hypothetical protein